MSSEDLEYRAKLVELIYSKERNLLNKFFGEADNSRKDNGHGLASYRLKQAYQQHFDADAPEHLEIGLIQEYAKELIRDSSFEIKEKYTSISAV